MIAGFSAIDPSAVGFQDDWRAEVTGWAPAMPTPIKRVRGRKFLVTNGILFAIFAVLILWIWQSGYLIVDLPPAKSEWAAEQAGFSDDNLEGLTGEGVKVCIVDTGIDLSNPAFSGVNVVFKDMIGDSSTPVDYGFLAHGTLMSGLLIAQSHQIGMSPNIQLGMVAALGDDGTGKNTADESDVAQAINWCIETFGADIISLSLGGTQNDGMMREGPSASAVGQEKQLIWGYSWLPLRETMVVLMMMEEFQSQVMLLEQYLSGHLHEAEMFGKTAR